MTKQEFTPAERKEINATIRESKRQIDQGKGISEAAFFNALRKSKPPRSAPLK